MCLSTVKEIYHPPSTLITDGWKEFAGAQTNLSFANFSYKGSRKVPLDKWLKAESIHTADGLLTAGDHNQYPAGFHIFAADKSSKARYRRVYVRNILCRGTQDREEVIVAQEMYVSSDLNGWPPKPEEEETTLLQRAKSAIKGDA